MGKPTFKLACVRFLGKHRGVSAPSLLDGAIPRFSFVPKFKNRVRTEGTENTEENLARDRAYKVGVPKALTKTGFAQRARRTRRKTGQGMRLP